VALGLASTQIACGLSQDVGQCTSCQDATAPVDATVDTGADVPVFGGDSGPAVDSAAKDSGAADSSHPPDAARDGGGDSGHGGDGGDGATPPCTNAAMCAPGTACNKPSGTCEATCGGGNMCNGCCDGTGKCQPGDAPTACGTVGVVCSVCDAGDSCNGGACVCTSGCPVGTPCLGSQFCASSSCRAGFCACSANTDCPMFTACQPDGTCTMHCSQDNSCNGGCCDGMGNCQMGMSDMNCGQDGMQCQHCNGSNHCSGGNCSQ
jgi:hypothetical protein